jgi:hypothetical protein
LILTEWAGYSPLHKLRNAVDFGIKEAAVRIAHSQRNSTRWNVGRIRSDVLWHLIFLQAPGVETSLSP